ncbi:MAG TPA: oxidoreductase, partial [Planctomycetota bacterium]|nr:oxidoreductase [Planctomycetota bacterium]
MTTAEETPLAARPEAALLQRMQAAAALLEELVADRGLLAAAPPDVRRRLLDAAARVFNPDVAARRRLVKATARRRKADRVAREERVFAATGIRTLRRRPVFTTPDVFPPAGFDPAAAEPLEPLEPKHCYVCKRHYTELHAFYDQLCPPCAALNFAKRTELADLRGRVALLTGGRVKIGYQAGLKLLRAGAELIVTTRFPRDSAMRYSREPDFDEWSDRLE